MMKLYVDKARYENACNVKDLRSRSKAVVDLAETGEVEAIYLYGKMLIHGLWDKKEMAIDLAKNHYVPAPSDPNVVTDPYLIVARNVIKAISYFKMISDYPDPSLYGVIKARKIIFFLQKEGLAGFEKGLFTYPKTSGNDLSNSEKYALRASAKSATTDDLEAKKNFIKRPKVRNPKTEHFWHMATCVRDRCIVTSFALQFFLMFISGIFWVGSGGSPAGWTVFFKVQGFVVIAYIIPLSVFACLINKFGVKEKLPICTCDKIKEAHQMILRELPSECKDNDSDPFESTSFCIRNLLRIKQFFFWAQFLFVIVFWIYCFKTEPSFFSFNTYLADIISAGIIIIVTSSFLNLGEKKFPVCFQNKEPILIFLGFLFFVFDDRDCCREIERLNERKEAEKFYNGPFDNKELMNKS